MLCIRSHFRFKNTDRLNTKEWKDIVRGSGNKKRAGLAIFMSDKIDFKSKTVR